MTSSLACAAIALAALLFAGPASAVAVTEDCHTGVYRLDDGRLLDFGSGGPNGDLRWRLMDGRTGRLAVGGGGASAVGWTTRPDGVRIDLPPCGSDTLTFTDKDAAPLVGRRMVLDVQDVTFTSGGVSLRGRLVLPPGHDRAPVMVRLHGSEDSASLPYAFEQRLYPAQGLGVFVYDKRGTGQSGGKFTKDFEVLAKDAVAAIAQARRLAGPRLGRIGFQGGSQGGFIAPLAATMTPADFVIADFGLVSSPAEQNTDRTVLEMRRKGYGPDDLTAIAEVARATNGVVGSHFKSGYETLDAVRAKYAAMPWFKELSGEWTGEVLKYSDALLRIGGPAQEDGTPINYDPVPVLEKVRAPMLWVLADDDSIAPNASTRERLAALAAKGAPVTVLAFPNTDHGVLEFITTRDGRRGMTRQPEGYLETTLDWAKTGTLHMPYGHAVLLTAPNGAAARAGR
jgi:pimeloyl-ACP methyl ester carboxylesterase